MRQFLEGLDRPVFVALYDAKGELMAPTTSVKGIDAQAPFNICSIGKFFTNLCALRLVEEGVLKPEELESGDSVNKTPGVQLPESVLEVLSGSGASIDPSNPDIVPVTDRLQTVSLGDLMQHKAGVGDYLPGLWKMQDEDIQLGKAPTSHENIEDYLQYGDKMTVPLGPDGTSYSNLGFLLLGLSIQERYNQVNPESPLGYHDILTRFVLEPAGIDPDDFSLLMPEQGRNSGRDPKESAGTASPAGGYWTNADQLAKFSSWLGDQYKNDEQLKDLVDRFGGEFKLPGEFSHGGAIPTSSCDLCHCIDSGVTIVVGTDDPKHDGLSTVVSHMVKDMLFS